MRGIGETLQTVSKCHCQWEEDWRRLHGSFSGKKIDVATMGASELLMGYKYLDSGPRQQLLRLSATLSIADSERNICRSLFRKKARSIIYVDIFSDVNSFVMESTIRSQYQPSAPPQNKSELGFNDDASCSATPPARSTHQRLPASSPPIASRTLSTNVCSVS